MQVAYPGAQGARPQEHPAVAPRRPTTIDLLAGALLVATIVLHVIAMFPHYFGGAGQTSLSSQPDQAAEYAVLAAGWALALGIGLSSPARAGIAAGLAVGVGATELGFRVSDVGEVFRYGSSQGAAGLWLMTAAWGVGVCGAVTATLAARRRARAGVSASDVRPPAAPSPIAPVTDAPDPGLPTEAPSEVGFNWPAAEAAAPVTTESAVHPYLGEPAASSTDITATEIPSVESPTVPTPVPSADWFDHTDPTEPLDRTESVDVAEPAEPARAATAAEPARAATAAEPIRPAVTPEARPYGPAVVVLVGVLSLGTAGAFLPPWDRYAEEVSSTGRSVTFRLGNAFSAPWQVVVGTVLAGLAIAVIPVVAMRLRNRGVGAAVIAGSLIVLASEFTSAVVQVGEPVSPAIAGLSPSDANQLGVQLHLSLTGWFTVDLLMAFVLFVVTTVLAHARTEEVPAVAHASSAATWPTAPEARSAASSSWP